MQRAVEFIEDNPECIGLAVIWWYTLPKGWDSFEFSHWLADKKPLSEIREIVWKRYVHARENPDQFPYYHYLTMAIRRGMRKYGEFREFRELCLMLHYMLIHFVFSGNTPFVLSWRACVDRILRNLQFLGLCEYESDYYTKLFLVMVKYRV